ncbi:unnamed protein product [Mytilus coruscus]|uniref:Protein kinase domain-containing protein n=1 Tax=Mytilus coruscus TaxID=42192 RepID=A0A6J8EV70_MYTCO|nr:unnamed protein product [Mytilus coruscus]
MNTLKRKHDEQYTRSRNPKLHIGWQHYRERLSKYSEETSIISCSSIRQCKDITSFDEPVAFDEVYNPYDNGFSICRMQIGGKDFIDTKFERIDGILKKTTRYPSVGVNIDGIIIHDEENLLIGLVIGTTENVLYTWFNDNVMISSGSMNIIVDQWLYNQKKSNCCSHPSPSITTTSPNSALQSTSIEKGFAKEDKIEKKIATNQHAFAVPEVIVKDLNIDYSSIVGRGAFGTVYKGKWTGLEVAVKAIPIKKRAKTAMLRTVEKKIIFTSSYVIRTLFSSWLLPEPTLQFISCMSLSWNAICRMLFSVKKQKLDMDIKARDKPHIMKQSGPGCIIYALFGTRGSSSRY